MKKTANQTINPNRNTEVRHVNPESSKGNAALQKGASTLPSLKWMRESLTKLDIEARPDIANL